MVGRRLKVKPLGSQAAPSYAHEGDAGLDLRTTEACTLAPGERHLFPTGLAMALPSGCVGAVCPRSGLAIRDGVTVLNAPGIVDQTYRGEVKVDLVNLGTEPVAIAAGDRIAQLVVVPFVPCQVETVDQLDDTEHGEAGHGSTGMA
jgi:dUTP pyrophosphatase